MMHIRRDDLTVLIAHNSIRIFCALILVSILSLGATSVSLAQNLSVNYQVSGYSQDGRYFAYEEFGREQVTRVSFAQISVYDLRTGLLVLGTPALSRSLDDAQTPADMLKIVRAQTKTIFEDLSIGMPAIALSVHGDGERIENTTAMQFGILLHDGTQRISGRYELKLEQFDVISSTDCLLLETGVRPQGFTLYFENFGQRLEIHQDKILSRKRGCPESYQIKAVYVPLGAVDVQQGVAMVMINIQTDNGIERRFLPVALGVGLGVFN